MSNALAIAHVTQALAELISANLRPEIDFAVTIETRRPPADPPSDPTITVFLYQVVPNVARRNDDLPTRAGNGHLVKRPAAALDLNYLITAYGEETQAVGQRLLGAVVRTLHEIPILPRYAIEAAAEKQWLAGSDFPAAEQKLRFTPIQMDVDETSKLWGMLNQTPYALSVCYQGTLVLIDGREEPAATPVVRERTVRVAPFGAPGAPVPPGSGPGSGAGTDGAELGREPEGAGPGREADADTALASATASAPAPTASKALARAPKTPAPARKRKATPPARARKAAANRAPDPAPAPEEGTES
ncbi:DUF4255 domain-containing protein [Streptomyces boninensis]|uniref:DUF4255 domain-containing protein n=1 Tax=Streptomyces boninensis TaxID=2039455 RepID=UPI003B221865